MSVVQGVWIFSTIPQRGATKPLLFKFDMHCLHSN